MSLKKEETIYVKDTTFDKIINFFGNVCITIMLVFLLLLGITLAGSDTPAYRALEQIDEVCQRASERFKEPEPDIIWVEEEEEELPSLMEQIL